nr:hypothetical protein CFP56_37169 [Quercus suber]
MLQETRNVSLSYKRIRLFYPAAEGMHVSHRYCITRSRTGIMKAQQQTPSRLRRAGYLYDAFVVTLRKVGQVHGICIVYHPGAGMKFSRDFSFYLEAELRDGSCTLPTYGRKKLEIPNGRLRSCQNCAWYGAWKISRTKLDRPLYSRTKNGTMK